MAESSVDIVIVSHNVRDDLDRCLASLAEAGLPPATTCTVVDNASTDGTPDMLRTRWPQVRLLEAGGNLGFARANNLGIRATTGALVLLLNPDTVVPPGAVEALRHALDAHGDTAAVGPRLVDAQGRPELSFGPMVSLLGEARQKWVGDAYARGARWAVRRVERLTRMPGERPWLSGACLLCRRTDLDAVGGFDERYFLYTEDVDLCAAFRARGRRVRFVPEVTVTHLGGRSGATAPAATARLRRRSQLAFYEKHHPWSARLLRAWLRMRGVDVG